MKVQYVLAFHLSDYFIHSCSKIANLSVRQVRLVLQQNFLKGENMYSIYRCAVLAVLQKCIIVGSISHSSMADCWKMKLQFPQVSEFPSVFLASSLY